MGGRLGALGALAACAQTTPEEPWLFHRPAWTWRWRSYGQVADQVARGANVLRTDPEASQRLAVRVRQDPDCISVLLGLQAAGRIPMAHGGDMEDPSRASETSVEVGDAAVKSSRGKVLVPQCHGPLEVWEPQALDLDDAVGALATLGEEGEVQVTAEDLKSATQCLEKALEGLDLKAAGGRPILSTGTTLDPICTYVALTWSLWNEAAWALEPEADAFAAAVQWARPTVVMAQMKELKELAAAFGTSRQRKRSRLQAVVSFSGGEEADHNLDLVRHHWQALGVEFRHIEAFVPRPF